MTKTRSVLIVGGSGFVGTHLAMRLRDQYKVFLTYRSHPIRLPGVTAIPLTADNRNWSKRVAYMAKPDVVIYAAGSNDAIRAEADTRTTEQMHVNSPAVIAESAEIMQPKFIYLSNCYVFDGIRGNYHETDTVLPATALGKSKLGGENFIRAKCLNHVIIRSSPLIGRGNGLNLSFFDRLRMALDRGQRVELPNHEVHSLAPVNGLADLVARATESGIRNKVLHYGGLTKLTMYEWAQMFAKRFGYDPSLIAASRVAFKKASGAIDPNFKGDYSLNSSQAIDLLKIHPLLIEESFDFIEKQLIVGP